MKWFAPIRIEKCHYFGECRYLRILVYLIGFLLFLFLVMSFAASLSGCVASQEYVVELAELTSDLAQNQAAHHAEDPQAQMIAGQISKHAEKGLSGGAGIGGDFGPFADIALQIALGAVGLGGLGGIGYGLKNRKRDKSTL